MKYAQLFCGFLLFCIGLSAQPPTPLEKAESMIGKIMLAAEKDEDLEDSILWYLSEARASFLLGKNWENQLSSAIDNAPKLYRLGYSAVGIKWLEETDADLVSRSGEKYPKRELLRYQIARGYFFRKQYQQCIDLVHANLPLLAPGSENYSNHLNLLGVAYRRLGQLKEAIDALEQTLSLRKKIYGPESNQVASVLNNLGNAYENLGLYSDAMDVYAEGLKIRKKILGESDSRVANFYGNLGVLSKNMGAYKKAISYYTDALKIFNQDSKSDRSKIADTYSNLANIFRAIGAYQESAALSQQAIDFFKGREEEALEYLGPIYTSLSILSEMKKEYDESIEYSRQAIAYFEKTLEPNHPRLTLAQNNLGHAYFLKGDYQKADSLYTGLFDLIKDDENQKIRFSNLNNDMADVYFAMGDLERSRVHDSIALSIQLSVFGEKNSRLAYTYNGLAEKAASLGNTGQALKYVQLALAANHQNYDADSMNEVPSPEGVLRYDFFITSLIHKARLISQAGNVSSLLQAKQYFELADSVLVQVRGELVNADDKIIFSERIFELTQAAIENQILLASKTGDSAYWEAAFQLSERSKNNVLAQSIQANQARHFAGIPDSLIEREDRLKLDINYYKLALAEEPDSIQEKLFQEKLFLAQRSYRELVEILEKNYPIYYQLKYDRTVPRITAIQYALPEQTALISYFTGASTLYSFRITKEDFKVYQTPISKDFNDLQEGFLRTIIYQDDIFYEDYINSARQLYEQLFAFDLPEGTESLIIVPDGGLSKLPFEALLSEAPAAVDQIDYSGLSYLVKKFNIRYELSASLYYQEKSLESALDTKGEGLLAFAPVFADPQKLDLFKSEWRNPLETRENDISTQSITLDGAFVKPLPATAVEVEAISEVFRKNSIPVSSFLFQEASEKTFKGSNLSKQRYIHIATHGFIKEAQPDLSGLMFFPNQSSSEDHILHTGEVYGLNLNADLVVLSACETGLGQVASGEGLLGFSRAFRYAGADNLLVSLWKVEDQATASLMSGFYQNHLEKKGMGFDHSLRKIKLNLINSKEYSHPYFWSAFVLIGSK